MPPRLQKRGVTTISETHPSFEVGWQHIRYGSQYMLDEITPDPKKAIVEQMMGIFSVLPWPAFLMIRSLLSAQRQVHTGAANMEETVPAISKEILKILISGHVIKSAATVADASVDASDNY
jgi:hypothetical protein